MNYQYEAQALLEMYANCYSEIDVENLAAKLEQIVDEALNAINTEN